MTNYDKLNAFAERLSGDERADLLAIIDDYAMMLEAMHKIAAPCCVRVGTDAAMYAGWRKIAVERVDIARAVVAEVAA